MQDRARFRQAYFNSLQAAFIGGEQNYQSVACKQGVESSLFRVVLVVFTKNLTATYYGIFSQKKRASIPQIAKISELYYFFKEVPFYLLNSPQQHLRKLKTKLFKSW